MKKSVLLPAAGKRTQFFFLTFTEPGRSLLVVPCKCYEICKIERGDRELPEIEKNGVEWR